MKCIGIDPGANGAAAAVNDSGLVDLIEFKKTGEVDWLAWLQKHADAQQAVIERVAGSPKRNNVGAIQKLAFQAGMLTGFLRATEHRYEVFTPQKWQQAMGVQRTTKTETDTQKKNRHKDAAARLFPGVKVTHATADALLIAEFSRRTA